MTDLKKYILIFLIILSLFSSEIYLYSKKKQNKQIEKAKRLIEAKRYHEAMEILVDELITDKENEEIIQELLDRIEKKKDKVINMIKLVQDSINQSNFEKAQEILIEMEKIGIFDSNLTKIMNTIQNEKERLEKINKFNNHIKKGEKNLVEFNLKNALMSYITALNVYRTEKSDSDDEIFNNVLQKFNYTEKLLLQANLDAKYLSDTNNANYDFIIREKNKMTSIFAKWRKIESGFLSIGKTLRNVNIKTKDTDEYKAYEIIIKKHISLIRRGIQGYASGLLDYSLDLGKKMIELAKNKKGLPEVKKTLNLLEKVEKDSFYMVTIDFKDKNLFNISKKNIVTYLDYITKKNSLLIKNQEIKSQNDLDKANKYYFEFIDKKKDKEILKAGESIEQASNAVKSLINNISELNKILTPYLELSYDEFKDFHNNYKNLSKKSIQLDKQVKISTSELKDEVAFIKRLLEEADKFYDDALKYYNVKTYDKAKKGFTKAKDKYYDVRMEMKSDYVNSRIDKVEKYLDKIEQIFFNIEMTKAEKYIEEAKSNFYAEKYNKAKGYIDEADNIYDKYNQSKEIIEYYRERINTAIKIQSGKRLSIDDQAYEVITELFKNAENYYNNKEYTRAREYISQILLEKPYYEKARLFEVKILVETDPESFEKIFKNYYNRAKEKYNHNLYADALIEFNQLLQFGKDKEKIKKYIYECKIKLNLIKPTVSGKDKKNARTLIKNAKENYAKENYKKALEEVNQALIIWEDVPEARSLKDKLGRKLKYKRPKLTRENELKFREAENAYSKNNFKKAYQITNEILKSQDLQKVRELNKKADKKRKIL